ncbi:MAG: rhodanese-related sulfurtransferase [Cytophagales bacterium]|nr:rhodanese-related sulfurtransferase [Cytophagales bacterium]
MAHKYSILLYYCYTPIADAEQYKIEHHLLCISLRLLGRVIIAPEGINGTVSGLIDDCQQYMRTLRADSRFRDIDFKVEYAHEHAFEKINVRYKPEIVHSDLLHIKPWQKTGIHLEPSEFKKIKNDPDVVLVDFRSAYEHQVGKFKGAITLDIENFRDFPDKISILAPFKNKKIITYCTGGIKCEKASAYLLEQGFENVYQLHGGIIKYGIEEGGEDFEGKCYVFDNRVAVDINTVNPTVISKCYVCASPSQRMVNCANPECNEHVPICEECGWKMKGACSENCKNHPNIRPYDGTGYYQRATHGYNPMIGVYPITKGEK